MRLFIAIDIPKEVKEKIRTSFLYTKDTLEFARFTEPENLHITLAFLGEMPESALSSIKVIIGNIVNKYPARDLVIGGVIIGPDENLARMIWLKFDNDSRKYLEEIADNLKNELRAKNIPFDNAHETLNGHITLARFDQRWHADFMSKGGKERIKETTRIKETFPEEFSALFSSKGVTLFSSVEKNGQRVYDPLFESDFKG